MKTTLTCGSRTHHTFTATSDKPIRMEDAVREQSRHGYPPSLFGLYLFESDVIDSRNFTATWRCFLTREPVAGAADE